MKSSICTLDTLPSSSERTRSLFSQDKHCEKHVYALFDLTMALEGLLDLTWAQSPKHRDTYIAQT